jgi:predicted nucleic acid-binding protein
VSGFLLDTNVVSELVRKKPEPKVVQWIQDTDEELLYLSVLTMGEIRKAITSHPDPARRVKLEAWLSRDLKQRFLGRILSLDENVADRWAVIVGLAATPIPVIDGLLAATAFEHNLTFVTRNSSDVSATGVPLFNPWTP